MRTLFLFIGFTSLFVCTNAAAQIFDQPEKLSSALASHGLKTDGWHASRAFPREWLSMSPLLSLGGPGPNGLPNNISFSIYGSSRARADKVHLKINLNNPEEADAAWKRLEQVAKALFSMTSSPMPEDLARGLRLRKKIRIEAGWGRSEILFERAKIDSYTLVLTDSRYLAKQRRVLSTSSGEFQRCKELVAAAVGYGTEILSGDGKPVNEAGYRSYMLEGRGKDLFFCEVHNNGRYKIKAALGGKFPFKYIAQGKF